MSTDDWDGTERRAAMLADDRTRANNGSTVEVPAALVIIGFVCVVLLQLGALVQHALIANDHQNDAQFRHQITCFVIGTVQGKAGTDLLTNCDFLKLGD
jgi:hypothetical protein